MSVFTPIDDDLTKYDEIVSIELFNAITEGLNYLIDATPVGTILPIISFFGFPAPIDADVWQICDGSAITNVNSPLVGYNTPDFSDGRMVKGAASAGTPGTRGGSHTRDLRHDHGGTTGINWTIARGQTNGSDTDYHSFDTGHSHSLDNNNLNPGGTGGDMSVVNLDPVHIKVSHYIKIQ